MAEPANQFFIKKIGAGNPKSFSVIWGTDSRRNIARAAFAGTWCEASFGKNGLTKPADIAEGIANGSLHPTSPDIALPSQHTAEELFVFVDEVQAESKEKINQFGLVAFTRHHLHYGPWRDRPMKWWSVDHGVVLPVGSTAMSYVIQDTKIASFEIEAAARKYYDEIVEQTQDEDGGLIPWAWTPAGSSSWSMQTVHNWVLGNRKKLLKERAKEYKRLAARPSTELSNAEFAKRFQMYLQG